MTDTLKKPAALADPKPSSPSGLPMDAVITKNDLGDWDAERDLGFPGQFPFTRGVYPTMYRGRPWTTRQYAGFGSAVESNQRYRYLLSQGVKGLSVAFDLPTQIGLDSDNPLALGEVGKVGVAIDSLEDMLTLFDGIPLERVSTSMTINSTAAILLALYVAVGKKQGANLARLSGTVQNDILKEYIARGTYIYPLRPAMRIVTDIFAGAVTKFPTGMPFRFPAITFAKPARPTCRRSRSPSPMASPTWKPQSLPGSPSTNSRRSSRSFSIRTMSF